VTAIDFSTSDRRKMKRRRISKVDQVHIRALQMTQALKSARDKGNITPSNPITGRLLAKRLNEYFKWDPPLSGDAGVRELANYARSVKQPITIGAEGHGYYYGETTPEVTVALASLKGRRLKIDNAIRGLESWIKEHVQIEAQLFHEGEKSE
jgi:hypothetical protein